MNLEGFMYIQDVRGVQGGVVYDDLQANVMVTRRGTSPPADRLYDHGIGGGVDMGVLGFAVGESVFLEIQTTHAMKLNSVLNVHMHFILPNDTNVGSKFQFQLDVISADIGEDFAVSAGSPFTAEYTLIGGEEARHNYLDLADIPAVNGKVSHIYSCELKRIAASGSEYGSEVYIKFLDCHYQKDSMGSLQEGSKY